MKKSLKLVISATLGVACFSLGAVYWDTHRFLESTDNAYVQADVSPVLAKVDGYVTKLSVVDNQEVQTGDVLAEVDAGDYATRVAQLSAVVQGKKAAITNLQDRATLQMTQISRASSTLAASSADQARANGDAVRFEDLLSQQYATRQRADAAQTEAVKAKAIVDANTAALATERSQTKVLSSLREQAIAELAAAQAQLDQAVRDKNNTRILAPVAGTIGKRSIQVGQLLKPGSQVLNIVQTDTLYVEANFKETQLSRMRAGQPVVFTVDASPGVQFEGVVDSISPATGAKFSLLPQDNAIGNYTKIVQRLPVKIRVTSPLKLTTLLRPGLSTEVVVDTSKV